MNRNPELRNERLDQTVPDAIELLVRKLVHTSSPGIVLEYDSRTKRAVVQPALRTRLLPTEADAETRLLDKPPILNVPVRQTATGGHMLHHQIDRDDVVLLVFSERGLDQFKEAWQIADPTRGVFFNRRDAMAIPWGREDIVPVRGHGPGLRRTKAAAPISASTATRSGW